MAELVRYETRGLAAHVTLDSPHNRNAISSALVEQLHAALEDAARDDTVRVVVLGHTGGTFCSGADLSEASAGRGSPEDQAAARTRAFIDVLRAIIAHPKPVVAAVDGHVRAGGMGLVAACDVALAGPASTFALTEVRLGLAAAMVSVPLAHRVEPRALSRWLLTGDTVDRAEAERAGLLSAAVDDLAAAVDATVEGFRPCSPQGLREAKALLAAPLLAELDARGDELAGVTARLFGTPEVAEGMGAFLERRSPSWATGGE